MGRSVSEFLEEQGSAYRIDARCKILMLAAYSVGIFFVDVWAGMAAYALFFAAACAGLRAPVRKVAALGVPVYVICAVTVAFNAFVPGASGLELSQPGFERGCFFAARILFLTWLSLAVCLTVEATELTHAFSSMLRPLSALRAPVDDIAMVFSIALRFIPQMAEEYIRIRDAQWCRCAEFDEGPVAARVRAHCAIMVPLLVGLFRRADRLASSMDARCYGMRGRMRTDIRARRMDAASAAACAVAAALCAAVSVLL